MAHLEWKTKLGLVQWLRFDAVRTVEVGQHASVTTHPVQKGADVSDHVRVALPHVSLTGVISIAPLTVDASVVRMKDVPLPSGVYLPIPLPPGPAGIRANPLQGGLLQAGLDALRGLAGPGAVESLVTNNPGDRASEAAEKLLELQESRELIRFVDELKTYEDMVITGVIGTRTQQFYGAVFQVELEQIKVVSAKLVDLPVPLEPRAQLPKKVASSPKDSGKGPIDEAKQSAALTLAKGLFSGIGL